MRPRRAGRGLAALAAVALMLAPAFVAAAEPCPYPLGDFILDGDFHSYPAGTDDPEFQIVDAVRVRPQYSFGQMAFDGATLHFAYESEAGYFPPNSTVESETHIIAYKEYSHLTGWNVTREWISSDDTAVKVPPGRHVQPTLSIDASGDVWVAWQVSGWTIGGEWWPQIGNYILYRSRHAGQWGPIEALSPMENSTSHRLPKGVGLARGAYVAWQTNVGEPDSTDFRIVGRTVGPSGLGPIENISVGADGFSDETVQLLVDGPRVVAVWAARNTSEIMGEGEWRVWASVRGPSGTWGPPVAVSDEAKLAASNPSAGTFGTDLYVVWSVNDRSISPAGDRSIVMRRVDLSTGELGPQVVVVGGAYPGYEDQPALMEWEGALHVLWASRSSLDFPGNTTNDTDIHRRAWDGASFTAPVQVSDPRDISFDEFNPAFLVVGDALHATYISDVNTPATGKVHDQRQMTRLLERPGRPYDGYWARYTLDTESFIGSGSVNLTVSFFDEFGAPVVSDHLSLVLADGSRVAMPPGSSGSTVQLDFANNTFTPPPSGAWCGKPVPIEWVRSGDPPPSGGPPLLVWGVLALAIAGLVGAGWWVLRAGRRGGPSE